MSPWILLVVIAQFVHAGVSLIDKYIVSSGRVGRPAMYAFYVGILSSLSLIFFLFSWIHIPISFLQIPSFSNVSVPGIDIILLALGTGFTFIFALVCLFSAFKRADASDVVPIVGSSSAVATLFFSFIFLKTSLTANFVLGFSILVIGTVFVSLFRFHWKTLWFSVIAGLLFGLHFVLIKLLFLVTHFDNAFLWSRLAIVAVSFILLLWPHAHGPLHKEHKKTRSSSYLLIIGNKVLAGFAAFLILKAVELGNVAVVQALGGLQFVFLLIFAIVFGNKTPHYCGENCTLWQKSQKIIAVSIIVIGFAVLFIKF